MYQSSVIFSCLLSARRFATKRHTKMIIKILEILMWLKKTFQLQNCHFSYQLRANNFLNGENTKNWEKLHLNKKSIDFSEIKCYTVIRKMLVQYI